jgi:hypothetical protein
MHSMLRMHPMLRIRAHTHIHTHAHNHTHTRDRCPLRFLPAKGSAQPPICSHSFYEESTQIDLQANNTDNNYNARTVFAAVAPTTMHALLIAVAPTTMHVLCSPQWQQLQCTYCVCRNESSYNARTVFAAVAPTTMHTLCLPQ